MRRLLPLVLLAAIPACSGLTHKHRGYAALADLTAIGGAALALSNTGCEKRPPSEDWLGLDCTSEQLAISTGLAMIGIAAIGGAILMADELDDPASERLGAPVVTVTPGPALPDLPAARVDAQTLQLARQARRASVAGDCPAARASLASVARRDPAYHAALVASPAVAGCR